MAYGSRLLRGFCIAAPFLAIDFVGVGVYQACGLGHYSLIFALCRKLVLEIPMMFVLDALFPLYGLPYSQVVAEVVLAVAAVIVLARLFKRLEREQTE